MANVISISGKSGSGKSTSIQYLDPEETFVIAVTKKDLPFAGSLADYQVFDSKEGTGNHYTTHKAASIVKILNFINKKRKDIKNIVIDDIQYVMSKQAMARASEKNFDKHTEIASDYNVIIETALALRDDLFVFTLTHIDEERDREGNLVSAKIKTLGKMLDNVVVIDGLYTWNIFTTKLVDIDDEGNEVTYYAFQTNDPSGKTTCKTPDGAFEELYIPNSLQLVKDAVIEYKTRKRERAVPTAIPTSLNRKTKAVKSEIKDADEFEETEEKVVETEIDEDDISTLEEEGQEVEELNEEEEDVEL